MMGNTVQKGLWLDPRAKLFLILMCVLSSMFAPSYYFSVVAHYTLNCGTCQFR